MANHFLCVSHNGPRRETLACILDLQRAGFEGSIYEGIADVALARCLYLGVALERMGVTDTLLLIDDDIVFERLQARQLCELAARHRRPVTGIYVTGAGGVALSKFDGLWVSGLGFLAIHYDQLRELADRSPTCQGLGQTIRAFTWTGLESGKMWLSEDYRLTHRLGGVLIAPICVQHIKSVPLRVTERQTQLLHEQTGQDDLASLVELDSDESR